MHVDRGWRVMPGRFDRKGSARTKGRYEKGNGSDDTLVSNDLIDRDVTHKPRTSHQQNKIKANSR